MQPKKVGPCKARKPRWYYNKKAGECLEFKWGGCQPNDNNFETKEECEKKCGKKIGNTSTHDSGVLGLHVLDNVVDANYSNFKIKKNPDCDTVAYQIGAKWSCFLL